MHIHSYSELNQIMLADADYWNLKLVEIGSHWATFENHTDVFVKIFEAWYTLKKYSMQSDNIGLSMSFDPDHNHFNPVSLFIWKNLM